jgi:hypothetical protein
VSRPKKPLPIETIAKRQGQAVHLAQKLDPALAEELRALTPEQYGERRGIPIQDAQREEVISMAPRNPSDVQGDLDEALDLLEESQQTLDDLQDRIDDLLSQYDGDGDSGR